MRPCSTPASKQKRAQLLRGQLQGKSGTRCAQTAGFLFLSTTLAGPADRFACKSFAADVGRGRGSLIVTLPLLRLLLLKNIVPHNPHFSVGDRMLRLPWLFLAETGNYAIRGIAGIRHFTCRQAHPAPSPVLTETLAQFPSLLDSPACSTQRNSICNSLPSPFAIFLKNSTDGL